MKPARLLAGIALVAVTCIVPVSEPFAKEVVRQATRMSPVCSSRDKRYTPISQRKEKAVLFAVRDCRSPTSYVFGTFHSDSPQLKPFYELARRAMLTSQSAGFELVMDEATRDAIRKQMMIGSHDQPLSKVIGEGALGMLLDELKKSIPYITRQAVEQYKPWAAAVLLQYPPPESDGQVMDEKLQVLAHQGGVPVYPMETVRDQFDVFNRMTPAQARDFINLSLQDLRNITQMHQQVKQLYLAQDLKGLYALSETYFNELAQKPGGEEISPLLKAGVLFQRNDRMARVMRQQMRGKGTFVAIGALHLVGEKGMLAELERQGYRIDPIPLTAAE